MADTKLRRLRTCAAVCGSLHLGQIDASQKIHSITSSGKADTRQFGGILATPLADANRMSWRYFLFMNALGGISWVLLLGGSAYLFGEATKRVVLPVQLLLLIAATGLAAGGIIFFHHHEKELVRLAESAIPGPLLGRSGWLASTRCLEGAFPFMQTSCR